GAVASRARDRRLGRLLDRAARRHGDAHDCRHHACIVGSQGRRERHGVVHQHRAARHRDAVREGDARRVGVVGADGVLGGRPAARAVRALALHAAPSGPRAGCVRRTGSRCAAAAGHARGRPFLQHPLASSPCVTPAGVVAVPPWLAKVRAFAEAHLQHTAWGPAHGRRDYETTLALAKAEGLTVDDDALYAAAYLHDMGGIPPYAVPGVDHGDRSIQLVDSILRDAGFPMQKSALVKEIIDHHQYYRPPDTLRVAVLFRDADILDFMGAIDVARIISLTTREKFTPDLAHAVAVIKQQMTEMPKLLQSDAAKREGEKRAREMQQYLDALSAESDSLTVL